MEEKGLMQQVKAGQTLQQVRGGDYITAVMVQKPREMKTVLQKCLEEASLAGSDFYYSWQIDTKHGKRTIEGGSIDLAMCIARNYGNCALPPVIIDEYSDFIILNAGFVDLESGLTFFRPHKVSKAEKVSGKYDEDRAENMAFQKNVSLAQRNVILHSIPQWFADKIIARAKEDVAKKILSMGIEKAKQEALAFLQKYGISQERAEAKLNKKVEAWSIDDLVALSGDFRAIAKQEESPDNLFPKPLKPDVNMPEPLKKEDQQSPETEKKRGRPKKEETTPKVTPEPSPAVEQPKQEIPKEQCQLLPETCGHLQRGWAGSNNPFFKCEINNNAPCDFADILTKEAMESK